MLNRLYIKNFAIIDEVTLDFEPGFNVLTGETGAGKSIVIDALRILTGERFSKDLIITNKTPCVIEVEISIPDEPALKAILDSNQIEYNSKILNLRRVFSEFGQSRQFINDNPVKTSLMKEIAGYLIDLHSPNEHQSILLPSFQLAILDKYAGILLEKEPYTKLFLKYISLKQELDELKKIDAEEATRQLEILTGQIEEFNKVELSIEEESKLLEEHNLLTNIETIQSHLNQIQEQLIDNEFSAFNSIIAARKMVEHITELGYTQAKQWQTILNDICSKIKEIAKEVSSKANEIDLDLGRLKTLEERLSLYQKFKRKFGPTLSEALEQFQKIKSRIAELEKRNKIILEKENELRIISDNLKEAGSELTKKREKSAKKLSSEILQALKEIGFRNANFQIQLTEKEEPTKTGYDNIDFLFSANAGIPPKALNIAASSGEISRIMLAIKSVIAQYDMIPTLVFDEIDVNISGITAQNVAIKMAKLAKFHQIICITHLPSVAAYANVHFSVEKKTKNNKTFTLVKNLLKKKELKK